MTAPILPGATIGILGGGQLGRMLAADALRMGYRVAVLDAVADCPAAPLASLVITGSPSDTAAALRLAGHSDVVTLETEHIPWQVLAAVAAVAPLFPAPSVLRTIQDRLAQKQFLFERNLPSAPFAPVADLASLQRAVAGVGLPAVLKTRAGGYDGKGQVRLHALTDLAPALAAVSGQPCILEAFVGFAAEVSVVLTRGQDGTIVALPLAENSHRGGILHTTRAPARVAADVARQARALAEAVAVALDHVGTLAVEMFLMQDGQLLINEIAPRVHNSGHFSLGACTASQFEQHLRAICGLPLADADLLQPAVMLNLLGDLWHAGPPDWGAVLADPHARLHLYGKREARPGRKMGHALWIDPDPERALAQAEAVFARLSASGKK